MRQDAGKDFIAGVPENRSDSVLPIRTTPQQAPRGRTLARQSSAHDVVHSVWCELSGVVVEALCCGGVPPKMSSKHAALPITGKAGGLTTVRTAQVRNAQQPSADRKNPTNLHDLISRRGTS